MLEFAGQRIQLICSFGVALSCGIGFFGHGSDILDVTSDLISRDCLSFGRVGHSLALDRESVASR